ncbi:MAG: 16S rRNA (uracil(1498)-N(3))-methyltransferase [Chitinophagaceae bacterium]|jgi:16S rRNA (uracil1498-N3)-methyltransferase|nr:16S rRNA (uracil(1498)-N(3))-methyltransferase [Chitinophagaceae bacterium]
MSLPLFFITEPLTSLTAVTLDEENSKHAIQVLRLKNGNSIELTDGKGQLATASIIDDHRKHCQVQVQHIQSIPRPARQITLAISLLKNRNRFEWLLEKVTELGVSSIIPLLCERTEKESARLDRMQSILQSALLQSRQAWLPELAAPQEFRTIEKWKLQDGDHFIATCSEVVKQPLSTLATTCKKNVLICIGPEGDFTDNELEIAAENNFVSVSLGSSRLRTETAGIVAVSLLAC